jgi:protein required for attachment to host cells
MNKPSIETGDWVVVCDGRKALILENVGDAKFPNLRTRETHEHPDRPTHEQGTSQPGRAFQSMGHGRSAVSQTDWHDEAERTFLRNLAARLNSAVASGQARAVTMIAAPRALGMIRPNYSTGLRAAIVQEVHKDLVKTPIAEIERMLVG